MTVRFLLPDETGLEALRALDPDRDPERFKRGECAWVLQTYLRLAARGLPVELTNRLHDQGTIVFHSKHRHWVRTRGRHARQALLIGIRGDVGAPLIADFELLQNGRYADGRRCFHVPHWPQPGLLARDPARGDTIRRIRYCGFENNLHPGFREPRWLDFLATRGIEWDYAAAPFAGRATDALRLGWHDFRRTDLVLAVRPTAATLHPSKPGTKLMNAWLAGAPALLGPEVAYRELRNSPHDYLEVGGVEQAIATVERLLAEPELYRGLRRRAAERARTLTPDYWLDIWRSFLFSTIPSLRGELLASPVRRLPLSARAGLRRLKGWLN
jgi:hypothetical protein